MKILEVLYYFEFLKAKFSGTLQNELDWFLTVFMLETFIFGSVCYGKKPQSVWIRNKQRCLIAEHFKLLHWRQLLSQTVHYSTTNTSLSIVLVWRMYLQKYSLK